MTHPRSGNRFGDTQPAIAKLGIDVSKDTLDVNVVIAGKPLGKRFDNTERGHRALIGWLQHRKLGQVHACLELTDRCSLGIALALHAALSLRKQDVPGCWR